MARVKDREKAIILRKLGMSYNQIKRILKVSKSTLSIWLKNYPLPKEKIRELRDLNKERIEKFRETMRRKREKRLEKLYEEQKQLLFPLTKREFFLAGLFLYWGEGAKYRITELSLSNTDPSIIKFFVNWLILCLKIPKEKLRIQLHLYKDMNIKKEIKFWSKILNIPPSQFNNPYIKKSSSKKINHKGGFGHGTCNVSVGIARLAERVHMSIKALADKYSSKKGT